MAAKLYTKLPSREDPLYEQQLDVAKNAAAVNFLGTYFSLKIPHLFGN